MAAAAAVVAAELAAAAMVCSQWGRAAVVKAGEWCRCHGILGEVRGVREREKLTAPDVRLPRTEPSKSANGG